MSGLECLKTAELSTVVLVALIVVIVLVLFGKDIKKVLKGEGLSGDVEPSDLTKIMSGLSLTAEGLKRSL